MSVEPQSVSLDRLLAEAGWIRGLARTLVRDAALADDLVQEAWTEALEHPPRHAENVRGWLGKVVRNALRKRRRAERSRALRELVHAEEREAAPDSDLLAERLEQQQLLAKLVMEQAEPYRSTLLLRFYEGWTPKEIARHTGEPAGTVRWRLKRALELLREELDTRTEGGRKRWLGGLAVLVAPAAEGGEALFEGIIAMKVQTKIAVALTGVLLLGGGLWLKGVLSPEEGEAELGAETLGGPGSTPEDPPEFEPPAFDEAGLARSDAAVAASVVEADPEGLMLVIVDAKTGEPLAGADVWQADDRELQRHMNSGELFAVCDPELSAQAVGEHYVADAEGRVPLPRARRQFRICARKDRLYGELISSPLWSEDKTLALARDRSVTIQVVDEAGNPLAGVPVALTRVHTKVSISLSPGKQPGSSSSGASKTEAILPRGRARTTAPSGLATIPHTQRYAQMADEGSVYALIALPAREQPRVELEPADPPAEPVRLVLPQTGSVSVTVRNMAGAPSSSKLYVRLDPQLGEASKTAWAYYPEFAAARCTDGSVRFSHVALGLPLVVTARGSNRSICARKEVLGPTRPGEHVDVELILGDGSPVLTGRLLGPDGLPFVNRELVCHAVLPRESAGGLVVSGDVLRTDAQGRFEHPLHGELDPVRACHFAFEHPSEGVPDLSVSVGRTIFEKRGAIDLGELRLAVAPVVIAGRVVGAAGDPLRLASCTCYWRDVADFEVGYEFSRPAREPVLTDEEGRFELRGALPPGVCGLQVACKGYTPTGAFEVPLGERERLVRMTSGANVFGKLILDENAPPDLLWVTSRLRGSEGEEGFQYGYVSQDGRFKLHGLLPGSHDVCIRMDIDGEPLIPPIQIEVTPAEWLSPAALQEVDLRGALDVLALRIVDAEGLPVDARGWFLPAGDDEVLGLLSADEDGVVRIMGPPGDYDVRVYGVGFRRRDVRGVRDGQVITLGRASDVTVRLDGPTPLPQERFTLWANFQHTYEEGAVIRGSTSFEALFLDGVAKPLLRDPGTWRVRWKLECKEPVPAGPTLLPESGEPLEFVVAETSEPQVFLVTPPSREVIDAFVAEQEW